MANAKDMTAAAVAGGRLGVSSSDATLQALITAASSALATFLGYPVQRREGVQETVVGRGGRYLWLESGALQSITSITVGGSTVDSTLYALDGEDGKRKGRIVARGTYAWPFTGTWTPGISSTPLLAHDTGEIVVTFTSGWITPGQVALDTYPSSDMPEELEQAALETITSWWGGRGRDGRVTSMATGDASVSWATGEGGTPPLPLAAQALAAPYRRPRGAR